MCCNGLFVKYCAVKYRVFRALHVCFGRTCAEEDKIKTDSMNERFSDVCVANEIFGVGRKTRVFGSEQFLYLPAGNSLFNLQSFMFVKSIRFCDLPFYLTGEATSNVPAPILAIINSTAIAVTINRPNLPFGDNWAYEPYYSIVFYDSSAADIETINKVSGTLPLTTAVANLTRNTRYTFYVKYYGFAGDKSKLNVIGNKESIRTYHGMLLFNVHHVVINSVCATMPAIS